MNIKELLQNKQFKDKYILKLLIQDIFNYAKEDLYKNWDKKITENIFYDIERKYKDYEEKKIPIEYILWYTFFMWKKIYVDKNVLIPRPETEYLLSYAYNFWIKNKDYIIFDIWTWSWIIWNILNILTQQKIICSDISKKSLKIAQKNNLNNIYLKSNLWTHLKNYDWKFLICANLPYVMEKFKLDEYVKKEPASALFAWQDWLLFYRKIIEQILNFNNEIECFFELTKNQWETLIKEYQLNWRLLVTCHENIKILNFSKKKSIKCS